MRECFFYTSLQRAFLLTPQYATSISSRTVLFTSVPKEYLNKRQMDNLFNHSVKNIWIPGDTKELDRIIQERDNVAMKLEKGEIKWIKLCNKERIKYENKTDVNVEKVATARSDSESGNLVAGWIPHHKRPTHRTGLLGLIGKKVDTIQWGRQQLKALIPKVQSAQSSWLAGKYKKHCAIFVEFFTLYDAHLAFHAATHHRALQMADRFIGIRPNEVIWQNLNYSRWQVAIRRYAAYATITGLIVFWAVPVTIIGLIAQVDVIKTLPGLTWIENIPQVDCTGIFSFVIKLTQPAGHSWYCFRTVAFNSAIFFDVIGAAVHTYLR
ncbi:protein RSN1 [Fusarium oxysporum f. sp. conglutinans]|nr:protein RSN1 [Fusarium oxysporum f. sp. conglutinans]